MNKHLGTKYQALTTLLANASPLQKKLLSGGMWAVIGKITLSGSGLILNAILARLLTPEEMGAYFIAISIMDQEGKYLTALFDTIGDSKGSSFEQVMFSLTAKMLECEPSLSELYQEENLAPNGGLSALLEVTKQLQPFLQHSTTIRRHYTQGNFREIWEWCRGLLEKNELEGSFSYLRHSINTYHLRSATKENTLAVLYFTYQILKEGIEV